MAANNTTELESSTDLSSGSSSSSDRFLTKYQILILNSSIGSLGIIGNVLVCFVFSKMKGHMRTLTNLFIFNQSVIDLATSVAFLIRKCSPSIVVPVGVAGDLYCMFWKSGFVSWSLLMASSLNLTTLTLERYLAVVHPITYRNRITRRHVVTFVIPFIWVVPFLLELFWAFANFNSGTGRCYIEWYSVVASKLSGVLYFMEEWLIPLTVIVFSYTRIIFHLLGRSRESKKRGPVQVQPAGSSRPEGVSTVSALNPATNTLTPVQTNPVSSAPESGACSDQRPTEASVRPGEGQANVKTGDKIFERSRRNVTKTMFVIAVAYLICWTPQAIWFFLYNVTELVPLYSRFHDVAVLMAYTNLCINPFIYAFQYQPFRDGLRSSFTCGRNKVSDVNSSCTESTAVGLTARSTMAAP